MPTPTKGPRLGGSPAHERLMLANLATSLFTHDRITTTEAKAKRLRPLAERLITFAKKGDLHARRQVMTVIRDKDVVHKLFAEIGPKFAERPGGYTRIVKVGPRKGDNAPMAVIQLVEEMSAAAATVREAERARGTRTAPRSAPTGRTREIAETNAGDSATAAGVAGAADRPAISAVETLETTDTTDAATAAAAEVVGEPDDLGELSAGGATAAADDATTDDVATEDAATADASDPKGDSAS